MIVKAKQYGIAIDRGFDFYCRLESEQSDIARFRLAGHRIGSDLSVAKFNAVV